MKRKAKEELRSKSLSELQLEVVKVEAEILKLQMEVSLGKVKNTSFLKIRTDVLAVIKTILQEKKDENTQR